jgi:hypothetical protein
VSETDFATIALALANDAVKTAHAGDFVKIAGDFYHIIKTNPTVADDLLKGGGVEDFSPQQSLRSRQRVLSLRHHLPMPVLLLQSLSQTLIHLHGHLAYL